MRRWKRLYTYCALGARNAQSGSPVRIAHDPQAWPNELYTLQRRKGARGCVKETEVLQVCVP